MIQKLKISSQYKPFAEEYMVKASSSQITTIFILIVLDSAIQLKVPWSRESVGLYSLFTHSTWDNHVFSAGLYRLLEPL